MKLFAKIEFHIQNAHADDYPRLADIHGLGFGHGWSEDEITSTLSGKGVSCLVATIRGRGALGPKGFMIMRTLAGQSEVLTIAIDPQYRRRGMARALMNHAIRQLESDCIGQFFLEVNENNIAALNLYRTLKFKQISMRKSYYSPSNSNESEKKDSTRGNSPVKSVDRNSQSANALVMQLELR